MRKRTKKNSRIKTKKRGGSLFKISPNKLQNIFDKLSRHKPLSNRNISKRTRNFKIYHNIKTKHLTKKNNSSSEYSSNAKTINISGKEWNIQPGNNNTNEIIPNILLPERKRKKSIFIRISSSNPKLKGGK